MLDPRINLSNIANLMPFSDNLSSKSNGVSRFLSFCINY